MLLYLYTHRPFSLSLLDLIYFLIEIIEAPSNASVWKKRFDQSMSNIANPFSCWNRKWFWPGSIIMADQLLSSDLNIPKLIMDSSKKWNWNIPFKKFNRSRFKKTQHHLLIRKYQKFGLHIDMLTRRVIFKIYCILAS